MKPVSIIQCSGMPHTGKTAFLESLGTPFHHFGPPMHADTAVGTYHALTQVMEEYTCWPAMADWNNRWAFWDRGLIEPYAHDVMRRRQTLRTSVWMTFYEQSVADLGDCTQVFIVAMQPDSKQTEGEYKTRSVTLGQRYEHAISTLEKAGAEVYVVDRFDTGAALEIVKGIVSAGRLSGFGHRLDQDGVIHFGNTGGR